jgi:RNA polymerase sigma-70 factor (ECF subfamily)
VNQSDLAEALATDLADSFERLVAVYQDRLFGFGLHLSGRPQDAEEITQEAFVRAYRALQRFPPERIRTLELRAWLHQIALNVFRNRVRGHHPESVPLDSVDADHAVLASASDAGPEAWAERGETRAALRSLVLRLPERYRAPLVLRHVEGMGYPEIAAALGQPVGTVKSNVHRGVGILREALRAAPELAGAVGRGKE